MSKEAFIIHTDTWPAIKTLSIEQKGILFEALICHQLGEPEPKMDVQTQMAFMFMTAQMDRDNKKYQEICERRAEYGRRGGIASAKARAEAVTKASKSKQTKQKQANQADNDTDTDTDTDTDNETETDTEAQERRPSGVSLEERELLDREFGSDRAAELIEEVELWAANSGKTIKDWPSMVRTFAKNQRRWSPGGSRDAGKLVDVAFEQWAREQEGLT